MKPDCHHFRGTFCACTKLRNFDAYYTYYASEQGEPE